MRRKPNENWLLFFTKIFRFSHLCLIKHLADVLNDDGDDEVGDGDGDHEDEEHEQGLNNAIAAAHTPY